MCHVPLWQLQNHNDIENSQTKNLTKKHLNTNDQLCQSSQNKFPKIEQFREDCVIMEYSTVPPHRLQNGFWMIFASKLY